MSLDTTLKIVEEVWKPGVFIYKSLSGSDCKKLEQIVNSLLPTVTEMCESSPGSLPNSCVENFPKFLNKIAEGNQLVEEYKKCINPVRKIKINERVKKLEKSITEFIQKDLQVVMASAQAYLSTQLESMRGVQVSVSTKLETLSEGMETVRVQVEAMETGMQTLGKTVSEGMETVCVRVESVQQGVNNLISKIEEQQIKRAGQPQDENICRPPDTPSGFRGFDEHIEKVKTLVLADGVNVIEITAMGGAGKSTLAAAVCNDDEIRGHFKDRVIYIVVSKSVDLLSILKTLWRNIVGVEAPDFTGVEHAHDQLQLQINLTKNEPILVVLDDIWSNFEVGKLLFEGKQYKTLVTTRAKSVTPKGPRTRNYKLPSLQPKYALSLFCHYAFDKPSIPIGRDKELIEKVQQQCKGLPLALKVIGRSLYGESDPVWERVEKSLSAGEPFRDDHKGSLLNKLKTSIDVLEDNERECFLDLGAFPQRKTIPAKELVDIWVYVRRMKWGQAEMLLWKFEDHHLLDLKKNPG
ncbi:probable disease resistance protein At4g33300 [Cryptomeria japonica]|uniref:probable disease resistance protein At4g33300 n=1 Tax=Cryptomeria japonica TaxID=3369 RepID=UPI0027D9DB1C|nr:probable disease resistance protein At4g33300 [Cryptomeria japonica]